MGGENDFADTEDGGWKEERRKHPEKDKSRLCDILGLGSRTQHLRSSHLGICQAGLATQPSGLGTTVNQSASTPASTLIASGCIYPKRGCEG